MKKIFTLVSAAMLLAGNAFAQDEAAVKFANPTYEVEGETYYVVQYDLEKGDFADANTFTVDETFVFAVDVTGTPLEEALASKNADAAPLLGYGIGFDMYTTNLGEFDPGTANLDGRLFKIKENVYGMIFNMYQYATSAFKQTFLGKGDNKTGMEEGEVTIFNDNNFLWGYNEKGSAAWWVNPIEGQLPFTTAPYDAAKKSPDFSFVDVVPENFEIYPGLEAKNLAEAQDKDGYAYPSLEILKAALGETAIESVETNAEVVAVRYFDLQGRQLTAAPENGLFIQQNVLSDGAVKAFKVVK